VVALLVDLTFENETLVFNGVKFFGSGWFSQPLVSDGWRIRKVGRRTLKLRRPNIVYGELYKGCLIFICQAGTNTSERWNGKYQAMIHVCEQPFKDVFSVSGVSSKTDEFEVLRNARMMVDAALMKAKHNELAGGIPENQIAGGLPKTEDSFKREVKPIIVDFHKGFVLDVYVQSEYLNTFYCRATSDDYQYSLIIVSDSVDVTLLLNDVKFLIDFYVKLKS